MADFCRQCSAHLFGPDEDNDMIGLTSKEETVQGLYATVLCETCGVCQVDHTGRCITHTDEQHDKMNRGIYE